MTYQIYARVSERGSDWEGETSCSAQIAACREHLQRVDPSATFAPDKVDEFISGRTNDRPALQSLLAEASGGTADWDAMAVLNIDRLTRSMEGYVEILRVLSKAGKGLIAVRQNLDLASPSGRFMLQLLVSAAEYFAHLGGENTKAKMLSQARAGQYLTGRPPFGYTVDKPAKDNILLPDPAKAPIVKEIFRRYAQGDTITDLRRLFKMPKNTLIKILRAPVYTGKISFAGQVFQGRHEPIIGQPAWDAVQARLPHTKSAPRINACNYEYMLSGMVKCSCGKAMSTNTLTKGNGKAYPYYRCQDSAVCPARGYIKAEELEAAVTDVILKTWKDKSVLDMATQDVNASTRERLAELRKELAANRKATSIAESNERKIKDMLLAGFVRADNASRFNDELSQAAAPVDALRSRSDALCGEIDALEAILANYEPESLTSRMAAIARSYGKLENTPEKRAFLRASIKEVRRKPDGSWHVALWISKNPIPSKDKVPYWHPFGVLKLPFLLPRKI